MLPVFGYFVMKWINVSISLFEKKMESKVIALLEYPITSNWGNRVENTGIGCNKFYLVPFGINNLINSGNL